MHIVFRLKYTKFDTVMDMLRIVSSRLMNVVDTGSP